MSEQWIARSAAAVFVVLAVVSAAMKDDIAWPANFVVWAIFMATSLIIGAIEKRER